MSRGGKLAPEVNRESRPSSSRASTDRILSAPTPPSIPRLLTAQHVLTERAAGALFIKNLSYNVSTEELFDLFGTHAERAREAESHMGTMLIRYI